MKLDEILDMFKAFSIGNPYVSVLDDKEANAEIINWAKGCIPEEEADDYYKGFNGCREDTLRNIEKETK